MKVIDLMPNIPETLKKVTKSPAGNLLVLGRLMYASFYTSVPPSRNEKDPKRFQYGASLLIPGVVDIQALRDEIQSVFEANVPAAQRAALKWKNPILDTAEDGGKLAIYAEDFPYLIRPNTKQFERKSGKERPKPGVVDSRGEPVTADREPDELYNGRWGRLSTQAYWYPPNDGKPGVALGLVNAQLLWHDDPLAGGKVAASADFDAIDDAELADMEESFQ